MNTCRTRSMASVIFFAGFHLACFCAGGCSSGGGEPDAIADGEEFDAISDDAADGEESDTGTDGDEPGCFGPSTQPCAIENGTGTQSRSCSSGTWLPWGTCTVVSCDAGYIPSGNQCIPDTGDWLVVVWQEDFEDWEEGYFGEDEIIDKWQSAAFMWIDPYNNTITDVGGMHGKVWRMDYPAGRVGGDGNGNGFGFGMPLGSEYTEMWLAQDIYIGEGFDYYNEAEGNGGGKVVPGLMGGPHVSVPYSILPEIADPLTNGWMVHGLFQPLSGGSAVTLSTYQYFNNMYDEWDLDWGAAVYGVQDYIEGSWDPGTWHNFTFRVALNDLGQKNGFTETFWDGVLKTHHANMEFRTDTEDVGITKFIDKIFEGFWFGGGTPSDNANWIIYDNIVAFYYLPSHPDYRSGSSTTGITPVTASGHTYADDFYVDETFTTSSGTIHAFQGSWTAPAMAITDKVTKTIQVSGASTIQLSFPYWKIIHVHGYAPYDAWVEIYDSSRTLWHTFNATNPPSGPYDIPGDTAYIDYYSGRGELDGGWTAEYTSTP